MADTSAPGTEAPAPDVEPQTVCLRCGQKKPVGEDGFCLDCEKAMEQACL